MGTIAVLSKGRQTMKSQIIPLTNDQIVELAPAAGAINPHETVSDRYSFVPTIEAVDLLRSAGWQPVHVKQSETRKNDRNGYQKHIIRFMQGALSIDQERVDLVMTNSHDRGCAFQLCASIWRKICGNGLMVSSKLFNFSHRHVSFDTTAFLSSAYQIAEGAGDIAVQVNDLKAIDLSPNEKGVFAMAAHKLVYDDIEKAPILPSQLLKERRYDDQGNDLWTTFNVVQENIMKGGIYGSKRNANGHIRRVKTRPVKSIDRDVRLNKALWILTEEMARLKN
ncbi:DUF932 domain-containing protein [Desulfosarcina ovata]|nr:DUF932 domain-containing protein [Desulfosarcina ovata]